MTHSDYQVTVRTQDDTGKLIRWLNGLSINWEPRDCIPGEDDEGTYYDCSFDTQELTWRKELELDQKPWVLVFCKGDGEYLHVDYAAILEEFLESDDFKQGVISSTKASWGGSGYSVELLPNPDKPWQILWNNEIGNKYENPGIILGLPTLEDDDVSEADEIMDEEYLLGEAFDIERDDLVKELREKLDLEY